MKRLLYVAAAVISVGPVAAQDQVAGVRPGYETWRCAVLAGLMREEAKATALFHRGYGALLPFAEAVHTGALGPADMAAGVPSGVSMYLGGPSAEFDLGAIWGHLTTTLEAKHLLNATPGIPYDPQQVVRDAGADYDDSGCRDYEGQ